MGSPSRLAAIAGLFLLCATGGDAFAPPRPTQAPARIVAAPAAAPGEGSVTAAATELRQLLKRQTSTSNSVPYTLTIAPDETCGFLSAAAGAPVTCSNKARCMWEEKAVQAIICGINFEWSYLRCLERDAALDPARCNDVCETNIYNLRCTNVTEPYCRTYAYPNGVRDYRCAPTPVSAVQSVSHTYNGQTDRTFSTLVLSDASTPTRSSTTTTPPTTTTPETSTSTSHTSTTVPAENSAGGGGGGSSQNIGAIVGGTVGGLAVISLFAVGMVFVVRRYRRDPTHQQQQQQQQQQQPPPTTQLTPGPGSIHHPSMYGPPIDPNTGQPLAGYGYFDPANKPVAVVGVGAGGPGSINNNYPPSQHGQGSPTSPAYDSVSVVSQPNRLSSHGYPVAQQQPGQPLQFQGHTMTGQPGVIPEMGVEPGDHHHGQIHELR